MRLPLNTIITGDCLEVMKDWPDGCVDIAFCDPPYGMKYHSGRYQCGNPHLPIYGDDGFATDGIRECLRLARRAVYAFCRWDNIEDLPEKPKSFIVWKKNNWTAGDLKHAHGRMWEGIGFWPQSGHEFIRRLPDVLDCAKIPAAELKHPTEKPLLLLLTVLAANIGDTVLDPYCGAGSICVAAKKLGRNYIGIDISPEYCTIARERLKAVDTGVPVKKARNGQLPIF